MTKFVSFLTPSRRLDNILGLFDNIEKTVSDPSIVEVLVKFDDDQPGVKEFIEAEIQKRPFTIKYIITPRLEGIHSVAVAMEQLFFMTDPESYFIQIISDEPRFETMHWDKILRNYVGYFKDDAFRLRLSSMKFANYASHYECTMRPDSFPFYTRRWLELTEGSGDCWGSDAYQQCVAFQLSLGPGSYLNYYRAGSICRDVVVDDIELSGLDFGVGVSSTEQKARHKRILAEWDRLTSFVMQEHFSYLARRIACYIWAREIGLVGFKLVKHENRKTVGLVDAEGRELLEVSYAVPRFIVYAQNSSRKVITFSKNILHKLVKFARICVKSARRLNNKEVAHAPSETTAAVQTIAGARYKSIARNIYTTMLVPYHFVTNKIDQKLKTQPPGITALTPHKMRIPKHIQPPTEEHIKWLEDELGRQRECRLGLEQKIF